MSPDVFLSRKQIRYDQIGLKGTPLEIVYNLEILNSTRDWNDDSNSFDYFQHRTDRFISASINPIDNPASVNPENVATLTSLMNSYRDSLKTGNTTVVYAVVDAVNKLLGIKGGQELIPPTDFDIIAEGNTPLGEVARIINECRKVFQESGLTGEDVFATDFDGDQRCRLGYWFDTRDAFDSLNEFSNVS